MCNKSKSFYNIPFNSYSCSHVRPVIEQLSSYIRSAYKNAYENVLNVVNHDYANSKKICM